MFINKEPNSVNTRSAMPAGIYLGVATVYAATDAALSSVLVEFSLQAANEITAAELMIYHRSGGIFYRNFMKMPDGLWRDSFGEKRSSLGELLPAEILDFREIESISIAPETVKGTE